MIGHLIIMIVMIAGIIGNMVNFARMYGNAVAERDRFLNLADILLMLVLLCMFIAGALHLLKGYDKQAAPYYKCFMLLNVISCVMTILIDLIFFEVNIILILISVLNVCKIFLLLMLAFGKDLGEKKTLLFFYMLLAADGLKLVLAIADMMNIGFNLSFIEHLSTLIADGTIGLSITGKYENKRARGNFAHRSCATR